MRRRRGLVCDILKASARAAIKTNTEDNTNTKDKGLRNKCRAQGSRRKVCAKQLPASNGHGLRLPCTRASAALRVRGCAPFQQIKSPAGAGTGEGVNEGGCGAAGVK